MNYFLLSNSVEINKIGKSYPQTKGLIEGYKEFSNDSMVNLTSDEFPSFIPDLRFELEDNAILTDVISPSNMDYAVGLLLNRKAKDIISSHKVLAGDYLKAFLKVKFQTLDYYWLHLVNSSFQGIDFSRSIFIELMQSQKKECIFKSEIEFETYYSSIGNPIRVVKLALTQTFSSQKVDLFFFPFIHNGLIASETLCDDLIRHNITGLTIHEQSFLTDL